MKIKNLAFYGVMAAILGSVGTARADDSTIIASKGYVDAYAQKQSDRVQATWAASTADHGSTTKYPSMATLNDALTTVEGNIQSVNTNALAAPEADNPKLTKVSAIKGMVTTSGETDGVRNNNLNAPDSASDQKVPSEKAVAAELNLKENHSATVPVLRTGQTAFSTVDVSHSVGVNLGDLDALKEDKSNKQASQELGANETVTRWDIDENDTTSAAYTSDTKYPTVKAVAQQIGSVVSAAVDDGTGSDTALQLTSDNDTAPSTRSVIAMAENNPFITKNASTGVTTVAGGVTTKFATTKAIGDSLMSLDGLGADGSTGESAGGAPNSAKEGQAVVKVTQTDGQVTAELGTINTQGIANGAVTRDKVNFVANQGSYAKGWNDSSVTTANDSTNNSNLGTGTGSKDTYVPTMLAVEKYVADNTITPNTAITASTDHSIVTYDANGLVTDGISLPGLNGINSATTDAECTQGAPCVLSYYVNNGIKYYKWTNMDTEGLNAVNDSNS